LGGCGDSLSSSCGSDEGLEHAMNGIDMMMWSESKKNKESAKENEGGASRVHVEANSQKCDCRCCMCRTAFTSLFSQGNLVWIPHLQEGFVTGIVTFKTVKGWNVQHKEDPKQVPTDSSEMIFFRVGFWKKIRWYCLQTKKSKMQMTCVLSLNYRQQSHMALGNFPFRNLAFFTF
jgi:hypothetical protein